MQLDHRITRSTARLAAGVLTAGVVLAAGQAHATTGRVWTLGAMNRFIQDDANRWLFPHTIVKYGSLFYLELYGLRDSYGATAPTSLRGSNDRVGPSTIGGDAMAYEVVRSLTANEFVPVQATAGGGTILGLTDELFLSLHLSDYENPWVKAFVEGPLAARAGGSASDFGWVTARKPEAISDANRKFDFGVAYQIPELAAFGLSLTYGSSRYSYTPNDNDPAVYAGNADEEQVRARDDIKTTEFRFLLGGGMEFGDAFGVDLGFGMGFHGLTYLPNSRNNLIDGGGGLDIQADVRAMIGLTEWWELVPAISFRSGAFSGSDLANFGSGLTYNTSTENTPRHVSNITDVKVNWLNLDLGLAGHMKPTDFIDFWIAAGYQFHKATSEYVHLDQDNPAAMNANAVIVRTPNDPLEFSSDRLSGDAFPYLKVAIEARVFSWLDLRAGVVKFLRADTIIEEKQDDQSNANNRNNDYTQDFPFFDYFVGAAIHYEGFYLDMQLDPEWFRRGPYAVSGAGGNMFLNGSLGYKF